MLKIDFNKNSLILIYKPDYPIDWIIERFKERESISFKGTFSLKRKNLFNKKFKELRNEDKEVQFKIGTIKNGYYKIDKTISNTKNDFYFHNSLKINIKYFVAFKNISILKKIDKYLNQNFYVGGLNNKMLPDSIYKSLIKNFPNRYEINKYIDARITSYISEYFDTVKNAEEGFNKYINKKKLNSNPNNILRLFKKQDELKLKTVLEKIETMLKNEINYSEHQWQEQILQVVLLLFPKYISVFKEVSFKDIYSNKSRRLDYVLIDYSGHIDIIEIKKPFDKSIMSLNKYRDNYIPNRELSGTIMQIEKYIYYLNKWGLKGETNLTKKFKNNLPENLKIRITNPRGIIILGRRNNLNKSQIYDFEIVKRKYKNVLDIFTYDDLIDRIKISIEQIRKL